MEVKLEEARGWPAGAVLAVTAGDTTLLASPAWPGRTLRFGTSPPAEPLPLRLELLAPIAGAGGVQLLSVDPAVDAFDVDLGGGATALLRQVAASQVPATVLQRSPVNVHRAPGLPVEHEEAAVLAAKYLDEHDLVQMFQTLLHDLLVGQPSNPVSFIEERLAAARQARESCSSRGGAHQREQTPRDQPAAPHVAESTADARAIATASTTASAPLVVEVVPSASTKSEGIDDAAHASRDRKSATAAPVTMYGEATVASAETAARVSSTGAAFGPQLSDGCGSKADNLLMLLQKTKDDIDLVIPLLPEAMRNVLFSDELRRETAEQFLSCRDIHGEQLQETNKLAPVVLRIAASVHQTITGEQCSKFVSMFTSDTSGAISAEEFHVLVQYVLMAAYLETPDGSVALEDAKTDEESYAEFLKMIETDQNRLHLVIPFLPQKFMQHLLSDSFREGCVAQFSSLDKDCSGALEPVELIPVIQRLCAEDVRFVDEERCLKFVSLFDFHGNGVINQDEFVEFAQFLAVMNFLAETTEGQQIKEKAALVSDKDKTIALIQSLERDPTQVAEVMHDIPKMLADEIMSSAFSKECNDLYSRLDTSKSNALPVDDIIPIVSKLSQAHPFKLLREPIQEYYALFDTTMPTVISKATLVAFARYAIVMAYLTFKRDNEDSLIQEILLGKERIEQLLITIRQNLTKISEIIPFLPIEFKQELTSTAFETNCLEKFLALDRDGSGVLEPAEVLPVVLELSKAHHFAMTTEHAYEFVNIFDSERNGVITKNEFANFVRFLLIMAYLEMEEGKLVLQEVESSAGARAIEQMLDKLESNRSLMRKILPVLPRHVFDHLASDSFIHKCHCRFVSLDVDESGVIRPQELIPLVVELSSVSPYAVTPDQCDRFISIFDVSGDGVLCVDEFLDFARFLTVMSYIQTAEGRESCQEAIRILDDSKRIEELLDILTKDRHEMQAVLCYLPDWLRDDLLSNKFAMQCMDTFSRLDKDGNGVLEPGEIYPLILEMAGSHSLALDLDQCKRFTAIFDDAGDGAIRVAEFVNYCRFHMIMGYLNSQEGQMVVDLVREEANGAVEPDNAAPCEEMPALAPALISLQSDLPKSPPEAETRPAPQLASSGRHGALSPLSTAIVEKEHLGVDLEYYRARAEKFEAENSGLRERLRRLEDACARLETRAEESETKWRHAQVDLGLQR